MRLFHSTALALATLLFNASASASAINKFDVNNDGRIDGRDAAALTTMLQGAGVNGSIPALPGTPFDLNGDGVLSLGDWREFASYAAQVGGYPDALFDVATPGMAPLLSAADRAAIAQGVNGGLQGATYNMRLDFNADGSVNLKDWKLFLGYAEKSALPTLLDIDANGAFNGKDLDRLADFADRNSYDAALDLNADGKVDRRDWQLVVDLAKRLNTRAIYDVDGTSDRSQPVISQADAARIVNALDGLTVGFPVSTRFDFNGTGIVDKNDWFEWVQFAGASLKQPELLFDITGDGWVNQADLTWLQANVGSVPVRFEFDLNADGAINFKDVDLLRLRLSSGAPQLLVGDVNRDNCVTAADLALVQAAQQAMPGAALWDPLLDVIPNGYIGSDDMAAVQANMGRCR